MAKPQHFKLRYWSLYVEPQREQRIVTGPEPYVVLVSFRPQPH
jgi:hypothetical protein